MHRGSFQFQQESSSNTRSHDVISNIFRKNHDGVVKALHQREGNKQDYTSQDESPTLNTCSNISRPKVATVFGMKTVKDSTKSYSSDGETSNPSWLSNASMVQTTKKHHYKKKKQVVLSFNDDITICFTISRKEISTQEHSNAWYTRDEYETMTNECLKQISKLDRGESLHFSKKYCPRGLESHTKIKALGKSRNRYLAYQAVLDEQEDRQRKRQERKATFDHQYNEDAAAIAKVYSSISSSCQLWAHVVGLADQREAEEIQEEETEQSLMMIMIQRPTVISLSSSSILQSFQQEEVPPLGRLLSNLVLQERLELARAA